MMESSSEPSIADLLPVPKQGKKSRMRQMTSIHNGSNVPIHVQRQRKTFFGHKNEAKGSPDSSSTLKKTSSKHSNNNKTAQKDRYYLMVPVFCAILRRAPRL